MSPANYTAKLISLTCKTVTGLPEIVSRDLGYQGNFVLKQDTDFLSEVQCRRIYLFPEARNSIIESVRLEKTLRSLSPTIYSVQSVILYQNTESLLEHRAICVNSAESN